jgi:FHS family L-fucose permease-like MFS transporter
MVGGMFFYSKDALGRSTGSQTLYIPYVGIAIGVVVLAAVFYFASIPEIQAEDDFQLGNSDFDRDGVSPQASHSIWARPHFTLAVAAQFFYVAAQAGVFSFFINYMTSEVPAIPASWDAAMKSLAAHSGFLHGWLQGWFEAGESGVLVITNKGAANLASLGSVCFLIGRFTGAGLLRRFSAHKIVGLYGAANVVCTFLIFCKLGWLSVACVFLTYFFMSIMFPTIFALGIFGLGARAKQASAFIVMAIMGGALLPKLMGYVADKSDMSHGFIVPMFCFAFVSFYGFNWSRFSKAESLHEARSPAGH